MKDLISKLVCHIMSKKFELQPPAFLIFGFMYNILETHLQPKLKGLSKLTSFDLGLVVFKVLLFY